MVSHHSAKPKGSAQKHQIDAYRHTAYAGRTEEIAMALTALTITSDALYTSFTAYKKNHKKKRLAQFLQSQQSSQTWSDSWQDRLEDGLPAPLYDTMQTALLSWQRAPLKLRSGETRQQQLQEVSAAPEKPQKTRMEKTLDQRIAISGVSLGMATAGLIVYAPLSLLSIPGIVYLTIINAKDGYKSLKAGTVSVDTIVTLTLAGCLFQGYFLVASLASFLSRISRKMLLKVKRESRKALIDVFRQQPRNVWVLAQGVEFEVPFASLQVGDIVVVHAGESVPVDGKIVDGVASIDQHILTGEAQPAEKEVGDQVFASTFVLSGKMHIEVERAGSETTVAEIGHILNRTADFKSSLLLRAEDLSNTTVLPTLLTGGLVWPFLGPMAALAVINAHFKHKMTIVGSISYLSFLNHAAQKGILIKDGRSLDLLYSVDTIVFDKTGTLTQEQPHVGHIHTCTEVYTQDAILAYAAAAEYRQTHPIAKAILHEADTRQLPLPSTDEAGYKVGYGLTVMMNSQRVQVGSTRFMELEGIPIPPRITQTQTSCHDQGHSLVIVAVDNAVIGAIELVPTVRPEAKQIIQDLRNRHHIKSTYIISGDQDTPTRKLAEALGIDHYYAETLPEQKAEIIEQLQAAGKVVCYIGDGINDSIALKKAQVSISLRGASLVATDTAQIILMDETLNELVPLFGIAQEFHNNLNSTFAAILAPALIGVGGVIFLHFGLLHTLILNQVAFGTGLSSAMMPKLRRRWRKWRLPSETAQADGADNQSLTPPAHPDSQTPASLAAPDKTSETSPPSSPRRLEAMPLNGAVVPFTEQQILNSQ
jgi:heavy metal translocating P-type ATPase